jgi:hypothetical protein
MSDEYKSSVLKCNDDDDGCPVCQFLKGSRDPEHLLYVIRVLDAELARKELFAMSLQSLLGRIDSE